MKAKKAKPLGERFYMTNAKDVNYDSYSLASEQSNHEITKKSFETELQAIEELIKGHYYDIIIYPEGTKLTDL